jgi:CubicO group peptidase (beta-lactamase class C family)
MTLPFTAHFQTRRALLAATAGAAALATAAPLHAALLAWQRDDPEGLGVAADLAARLDEGVKSGELVNLHGVFVVRRGKLAVERYYPGVDQRWGTPLGTVAFDATTLHDLRSVSKSIVGLLYGIALAEGKVPALDAPVLASFPEYQDLASDERRRAIRMVHVLTMTMGLEWNEDLPYTDPRNSEIAMEASRDRYRYILERPITAPPGQGWRYSGGATALLGHLIAKGTGMPLLDYAKAKLFGPMDIAAVEWTNGFNGEASAASGLRMRPADLASMGQLVMQRGRWGDRQVVPSDWMTAALTPRITAWEGMQYGYHWYVPTRRDGSPAFMGIGLGGQRLVVVPSQELVYVIFMGNYTRADQVQRTIAVQGLIHAAVR